MNDLGWVSSLGHTTLDHAFCFVIWVEWGAWIKTLPPVGLHLGLMSHFYRLTLVVAAEGLFVVVVVKKVRT